MDYVFQERNGLPAHIKKLVETPPPTGTGKREVHRHILRSAALVRSFLSSDEAFTYLSACSWPRRLKTGELEEAVQKAYALPKMKRRNSQAQAPPKLQVNLAEIEAIVAERFSGRSLLEELRQSSPVPIPESTDQIIRTLFPPDSLLCVGWRLNGVLTAPLANLSQLETYQFIVPSPMSALDWTDGSGRRHHRGNANTGPRRFLVTDLDIKPTQPGGAPSIYAPLIAKWAAAHLTLKDAMAALIIYLAEAGPLSMVVDSGNVSLQAWWYCQGESEALSGGMRAFFESAVMLGADPAGWIPCQLFRMPGAQRLDTGRPQAVVYYNPDSIDEKDSQSSQDQNQDLAD